MTSFPPVDWFTEHIPAWEPFVSSRKPKRALFVGPYDGRVIDWVLSKSPDMDVTVVDEYGYEPCAKMRGKGVWHPRVFEVFVERMQLHSRKVVEIKNPKDYIKKKKGIVKLIKSDYVTGLLLLRAAMDADKHNNPFDLIYIDSRSSMHAMESLVLCVPMLEKGPGGFLVVTNNTHGHGRGAECPRRGIDGFFDAYAGTMRLLRNGFHVFAERRATPLKLPPCLSEYFDEPQKPPKCPEQ